ncbi:hypothetical protein ASG73_16380 [Janibacter sp. Soil728]|uniref:hypothetical protein n=1 Tax=Janibacter sp. Soil728 TaxID=1736393 RepID=UPI0006F47630|nr:hypothetical protein [Janibacter sp. Soil728]KRE35511.1 hypothetical protein ASG73_16380 [Janibacter sp. Soil728]
MTSARISFIHPVQELEIGGGQGSQNVLFPAASFAVVLDEVEAADRSIPRVECSGWSYSTSLQARYSYLSDVSVRGHIAWTLGKMEFDVPVASVRVTVVPWSARKAPWLDEVVWESVVYRASTPGSAGQTTLSGIATLEAS